MEPAITGKQDFASDRSTTEYEFDFHTRHVASPRSTLLLISREGGSGNEISATHNNLKLMRSSFEKLYLISYSTKGPNSGSLGQFTNTTI